MSYPNETTVPEDNAFGPETDLILSLLVIVLLVGVLAWFQGKRVVQDKDRIIQRDVRTSVFQETASTHAQGSAAISPEYDRKLRSSVSEFVTAIRASKYAYLEVGGYASPEAGKIASTFDINLIKGLDRAQAVAKILHSGGLPYECMVLSSFGRTGSELLSKQMNAHQGVNSVNFLGDFDRAPESFAKEADLARERRTEIWGIPPLRNDNGTVIPSVCMLLLKVVNQ